MLPRPPLLPWIGDRRRKFKPAHVTAAQVEELRGYACLLVEASVQRHARVAVASRLLPLTQHPGLHPDLHRGLLDLARQTQAAFPAHSVAVTILDGANQHRVSVGEVTAAEIPATLPEASGWCRYGVATAQQFEVADGRANLLVCSPGAGVGSSYLGAPVFVQGQPVGMVCAVSSKAVAGWTAEHRQVIDRQARRASALLEDALAAADRAEAAGPRGT